MKVIFLNPSFNRYGGISGHGGSMIPLNLCYLAAYSREKHPEIEFKILDAEISGLSHEDTVEEISAFNPGLIGITANTCVFDSVIAVIKLLKTCLPEVPIVIGGPHPSALPENSLRDSKADFAVVGEGEMIVEEIIARVKRGENDWNKVHGMAYRDEHGNIYVNSPGTLIEDLDTLPFPARDLVDSSLYSPAPTKRVSLGANTMIATSRGCPYNCGFCGAQTVWTRKIRTRKPEFVVKEIDECVEKHGIQSFNFTDEFFTGNKKRVLEICRLICESGLNISWVCSARAQRLNRETLVAMRKAGCHEISFGIESGNPEILKRIDKDLDLDEAQRVIRLTKQVGIISHASYILGYIGETEETIKETIRFAKKLNTHIAAFFIASPLPGTPLYHEAQKKGYLRSEATWFDYSPLSNSETVLKLPNLSTTVIRKWHRKAIRSYYFRPKYILLRLVTIRHLYEIVNLLEGLKVFLRIRK